MQIKIEYEDEQIVVITKPVGVVCNRAMTVKEATIQDWMDQNILKRAKIKPTAAEQAYFWERSGLVHRLDKETSGLMVLAKTPEAFEELLRQFREREVQKEYLALTHGKWQAREGVIELPVGRMRHNRKQMGVREDGRESVTRYQVSEEYDLVKLPVEFKVNTRGYAGFSVVRFWPKTGRMHQIRVHAKQLGHPLVGDELYAGRKRSREDRKWAQSLMLAAVGLRLRHPSTKAEMNWEIESQEIESARKYLC